MFLCASSVIFKKKKIMMWSSVCRSLRWKEQMAAAGHHCHRQTPASCLTISGHILEVWGRAPSPSPPHYLPSPLAPTWRGRSQTWCNYTHLAAEKSQDWQVVCGLLCLSPDKGHDPPLTATVLLDQGSPTILVRGPDTMGVQTLKYHEIKITSLSNRVINGKD